MYIFIICVFAIAFRFDVSIHQLDVNTNRGACVALGH